MIKGTIDSDGKVRVTEQGRVEADVHAHLVAVAGTITGNITADDRIILEPTARVDGNITAPRILIEDGATFKGQVNMRAPERSGSIQTSSARKDPAGR
jgi:cytoskeletal protein CcmA (bactofilin family)